MSDEEPRLLDIEGDQLKDQLKRVEEIVREVARLTEQVDYLVAGNEEIMGLKNAADERIAELEAEASAHREETCGRVEVVRRQDEEIEYLRDTTIPKVSLKDSGAVMGEIKILRNLHEKDADRIAVLEKALEPFSAIIIEPGAIQEVYIRTTDILAARAALAPKDEG